jgi:exopolysaccharide biosynthesis polyprenyl glycosylphosphotransferase
MIFRRTLLLTLYKFSDIIILCCGLALAIGIIGYPGKYANLTVLFSAGITVRDLLAIVIAVASWHILFRLIGLYDTKRFGGRLKEGIDILKATFLGTCIISVIANIFLTVIVNSHFVYVFWISTTILTLSTRVTMRLVLVAVRYKGRNLRHIVILGTNERAVQLAEKIEAHKEMGYNILGFVDNECKVERDRIKLLSDLDRFSEVLDQQVVDEVIIALPIQSFYAEIRKALSLCEEQGIKVRFIMEMLFDQSYARSTIEYMDDDQFLTLSMGPHDGLLLRIKRIIDITNAALALILLAPLFVMIGIVIKLESRGPIFFVQERVGFNKRRFDFYKFRTMRYGAEKMQAEIEHLNEVSGPVFKIKDDPRITRIGKILRKTSLDELPQLFNVLKGDMSLVGPRPLPIRDYKRFEKNWQKRRFSVRPGLTCLWQIQGRNELTFERWIELDMEYIDHWSLLLDLRILVRTIPAVIRGTGAM